MQKYQVELIPIFEDNYVFMIVNTEQNTAIVVDPGEASAVMDVLAERKRQLSAILVTHHHLDHIGGLQLLSKAYDVKIYAPLKNKTQVHCANTFVAEGDRIKVDGLEIEVIDLPGHTLGHVAYCFAEPQWIFSGDVLFGLGCGRLFEGTFEQMFESLQKLKKFPGTTQIFCTHEYTETNLRFSEKFLEQHPCSVATKNIKKYSENLKRLRAAGKPSVPLNLQTEIDTNLFLRAKDIEEFTLLRTRRNQF